MMRSSPNVTGSAAESPSETPYRERLRAGILARAIAIVASEGLAELHARRIAVDVGCSVGTIYNIYGDLDGLIIAANAETLALMDTHLRAAHRAGSGETLTARLTLLALTYMEFAYAHRRRWSALFEHRLGTGKELPEHYEERRARLLALLGTAIGDGVADPALRARAARVLFAAVHGIIALAIDNKLSPFDPATVEAEIRFIVSAAVKGLD